MPILWILVVAVLLYIALKFMDEQYNQQNKKESPAAPPAVDAGTETAPAEQNAADLSPAVETAPDTAPAAETEADDAPDEAEPDHEESGSGVPFLDTIPGLPGETKEALQLLNLTTAQAITNASDKKLLAVKGIGPARLKQIRSLCAGADK